ncbi:unnamed protein product [Prorocentrum cordatum]|uniref:RanBP2-type domain-containing protein n=1 Tax=Prorocentrum cordatum TaxID=2364126 RepID=A0ABN9QPI3_9DINO|nr:unnamed protein product [Polarella glacialis]
MAKGDASGQRWTCTKCGCKRNLGHWWRCKHCRSPYSTSGAPEESDDAGAGWNEGWWGWESYGTSNTADSSVPMGLPACPGPQCHAPGTFAPSTIQPDAKLEDIQATIDTLTKVGDRVGAASYSKILEQRKANPASVGKQLHLQQRVYTAFQSARTLEGKLEKAVAHFQRLETQLAEQKDWVSKVNDELVAAETEHPVGPCTACQTCGPPNPTPPAPGANVATIPIDGILEGKSDLLISMGSFGQLDVGIYELDQPTRDEAMQRMDKLHADIKAAIGVLLGDAPENIKAAKEEHQALLGRLQKKKRKVDGADADADPAATAVPPAPAVPEGAAPPSEPVQPVPGAPASGSSSGGPAPSSAEESTRRAARVAAATIWKQGEPAPRRRNRSLRGGLLHAEL